MPREEKLKVTFNQARKRRDEKLQLVKEIFSLLALAAMLVVVLYETLTHI